VGEANGYELAALADIEATQCRKHGACGGGKIVCVVSGGNIDSSVLQKILAGNTP
jgi:threonine dehydratase